jgi:hypothetical protein
VAVSDVSHPYARHPYKIWKFVPTLYGVSRVRVCLAQGELRIINVESVPTLSCASAGEGF